MAMFADCWTCCRRSVHLNKTPVLTCRVQFTPTVQHCSMATLIGLCLRVKLMQSLPARFKVLPSCSFPLAGAGSPVLWQCWLFASPVMPAPFL